MHLLESRSLSAISRRKLALVPALPLLRLVFVDDVGGLEDLDGEGVFAVFADGLEDSGDEGCAHDLVFGCLGVGELDGSVVVGVVQPAKVLVVRAKNQRHDLAPAGHGTLQPDDIGELVDGEGLGDRGGLVGEGVGKRIVAVGDGNILHDVALVENIGASDGNVNIDEVGVGGRGAGDVGHLGELGADVLRGEGEAAALVNVGDLGGRAARSHVGSLAGLVVVGRDNLDGLNGEGLFAVLREHGNKHVRHNLHLRLVRRRNLNKDILGVEGNLGVVAVDDWWQRADCPVLVEDDGVYGRVPDNVEITSQVLVVLVKLHQPLAIHLLRLVERNEGNLLWLERLVGEGALDGIQVVGAHGDESPLTAQVQVELVLKGNEGVVTRLGELDSTEDGSRDVRPDLSDGGIDAELMNLAIWRSDDTEVGELLTTEKDVEVHGDTLEAEHVISRLVRDAGDGGALPDLLAGISILS